MKGSVRRSGYTLLETLLVMAIITVLIALLMSAVMRVWRLGQTTQTKSEMAQLSLALGQFRDNMHAIPMLWGGGPQGQFRLCSTYQDANGNPLKDSSTNLVWPEITFLKKVWPQMSLADNGLRSSGAADNSVVPYSAPILLDGNQAAMFWMTGLNYTSYQGFAKNPQQPFMPYPGPGAVRSGPFMQIQMGRLTDPVTQQVDNRYRDVWGMPYCIMGWESSVSAYPCPYTASIISASPNPTYALLWNNVQYTPGNNGLVFKMTPYLFQTSAPNPEFFSAGGFQIISAGINGEFGAGGILVVGNGGPAGADDMANFRMHALGDPE